MQIQKEFLSSERKFRNSKNNFARKRGQISHNTRTKIKNTSTILKTPKLKRKSALETSEVNIDELLHFLYPIVKNYLGDQDLPYMNKYSFVHFLLEKINKNYELWNIIKDENGYHLYVGSDNECSATGHCAELHWIYNLKSEWKNLIIDMLSYFVQKYNIPVLFNQEYYTEIAQDRFFCDREDFGDKEAQNEIDKLIKFYENEVGHISNQMNFKREESTYENLIKRCKKLKPTNFKYQKIKAWIQQGLEIVTQNFNFYHPYPLFQDDEDNYCFGPELYCNFVWKVDELDPVWDAYDSEIQMYYNEYAY